MTQSFFSELLNRKVHVIDVGGVQYEDYANYYAALKILPMRVLSFDPLFTGSTERLMSEEFDNLELIESDIAIGDGSSHSFHVNHVRGNSSLLSPDRETVNLYHAFGEYMTEEDTKPVRTVPLDTINDFDEVDFLKIDVQGSEDLVIKGASATIRKTNVIECEVNFISQYEKQPLFADVSIMLRNHGFFFHTFTGYGSRSLSSTIFNNDKFEQSNQWIMADAVFVRHLPQLIGMSETRLVGTAFILHEIYHSFDVAYEVLKSISSDQSSHLAASYLDYLRSTGVNIDRYNQDNPA